MTSRDENEKLLIGAILSRPDNYLAVVDIVRAEDFAEKVAYTAFQAVGNMIKARVPVNLITLSREIGREHTGWLMEFSDMPGVAASAIVLARSIAEAAKRERIGQRIGQAAHSLKTFGTEEALRDIHSIYREESGAKTKSSDIASVVGRFEAVVAANKKRGRLGFPTGFNFLSDAHVTYQQGHLWVIGAWTSTGKTAVMVEMVKRLYGADNPEVIVFSTEMTEEQNVGRILANISTISSHRIMSDDLPMSYGQIVADNKEWLLKRNLHIFDKVRTVDGIANQCRKIEMEHGRVDVVFVDFIQNITKPGCSSKYEMMSEIALDLQELAKDLRCCIVCLSQIPNSAGREDAGILEYKGAGEIAAAADLGVMLKRDKKNEQVLFWETRKNRHGPCCKAILQFVNGWTSIDEVGVVK